MVVLLGVREKNTLKVNQHVDESLRRGGNKSGTLLDGINDVQICGGIYLTLERTEKRITKAHYYRQRYFNNTMLRQRQIASRLYGWQH